MQYWKCIINGWSINCSYKLETLWKKKKKSYKGKCYSLGTIKFAHALKKYTEYNHITLKFSNLESRAELSQGAHEEPDQPIWVQKLKTKVFLVVYPH